MIDRKLRLLWADDDGPRRFKYEQRRIRKKGWEVDWAHDAEEASTKLSETYKNPYQALLLDQMFPYKSDLSQNDELSPWGGCLLLYWLRGRDYPEVAPPVAGFNQLNGYEPAPSHSAIPVMIVSAYYEGDVRDTMMEASSQDRDLSFAPKPVNVQEILSFLDRISGLDRVKT